MFCIFEFGTEKFLSTKFGNKQEFVGLKVKLQTKCWVINLFSFFNIGAFLFKENIIILKKPSLSSIYFLKIREEHVC